MVEISTVFVQAMLGHELDNLKRAFGAGDIWKQYIGLKWVTLLGGVDPQTIR
jgi:hypothetical protein